jgi:hypothetical protein
MRKEPKGYGLWRPVASRKENRNPLNRMIKITPKRKSLMQRSTGEKCIRGKLSYDIKSHHKGNHGVCDSENQGDISVQT